MRRDNFTGSSFSYGSDPSLRAKTWGPIQNNLHASHSPKTALWGVVVALVVATIVVLYR